MAERDLFMESQLISSAEMSDALERVAHDSVRQITTAVAFVYLPFAAMPVIRSGADGVPLALTTLVFAAATVAFRFGEARIARARMHMVIGLTVGLFLVRALLGWWYYGGESETGFVSGALMISGLACLSWSWIVTLNFLGIVGWALILLFSQHAWPAPYMVLLLLAGPVLATVLHRVRVDGLRREETYRIFDRRNQAALKEALLAKKRSEERFRGIVERTHDVFARCDLQGIVEFISPSVERYGYRPEELVGKPIHVLHASVDTVDRGIQLILEQGEVTDYQSTIRTKTGERREGSVSARLIYENGVPVGIEGALRDMTERKRLIQELQRNKDELEHAQRLCIMGEMLTQMAHELNQPLTAINAHAAGCARRVASGDVTGRLLVAGLNKISEQALRAADIIESTRRFASKKAPTREALVIAPLLEEVLRFVEPVTLQHLVTIRVAVPEQAPPVLADRVQILQVLANLLLNAVEALEGGEDERELAIVVSGMKDDAVEIAVHDCGPGLGASPNDVFEPFVTTKPGGLGMGLAISRSIIEAHNGRLWATPNTPRGTTFHFTLPVAKPAASEDSVLDGALAVEG